MYHETFQLFMVWIGRGFSSYVDFFLKNIKKWEENSLDLKYYPNKLFKD